MIVSITRAEVLKIADLAKLHYKDEELDAFVLQFQNILEYVEQLKEVDVENVPPTSHVSLASDFEKHIFREDEIRTSLPEDASLSNAPDPGAGHFRVPKVL
jgi:aspartyl-tRNA(Asn)/glutamyl-tRNA(Gln) amidotransferase subunit C